MILVFDCVLAEWVFAVGLLSVQQLCWFLGGIKSCVFLSELLRKLPFSIISEQQSYVYFLISGLSCSRWGSLLAVLRLCCCLLLLKAVPGEMCLLFFPLPGELVWPLVQPVGRGEPVAFLCSS